MRHEELTLEINGDLRTASFPTGIRLLDAIRRLGYTGTKEGCGEGECGACTVLLDGRPVNSCLVYAKQALGKRIRTVEAIGAGYPEGLHPFQRALVEAGGVQCGFCTPGIVVIGAHHLDSGGSLEDADIRQALSGNLCRCTGYAKIMEALRRAGGPAR
ncbi:MAG: (2Fe-2S)-binding protein [Myxococcales bacterium]|nr:(2Fe-2S)-binding protein [Myxococcales bacterium]